MPIRYDKPTDTLTVVLGHARGEIAEFETGDYSALVDENDELVEIQISNASRFLRQALAAGVEVPGAPAVAAPAKSWHTVDSSMISGFGYDETESILEVAFHRTGTYRYFDVPYHIYEGLLKAESKGSYMRDCIIDNYDYDKGRRR